MPDKTDCSFMKIALDEAKKAAELGEIPIGAVLVAGDLVVKGHNRVIKDSDPTAHAEIVVIREAAGRTGNYRLSGSSLYVTLEPCIMCVGAIVHARIGRLVFGAFDDRYGAVGSMVKAFDMNLNHTPEVISGVFAEESSLLLSKFFEALR
ncbi:MAG: tRNA adenosine(34) deaminase TadA [Thermodesulfobacteriota bacterium]|nr:tRNA adenosine(34) deaminase TadA [Thermodesulfobacteriota bacterium]